MTGFRIVTKYLRGIRVSFLNIVVANHPFGALEGIILTHILLDIRKDVRILANELLGRVPELKELFFEVDVFSSEKAKRKNTAPLRKAIR